MAQLHRSIPDRIRIFSGEDYRLIRKSDNLAKNDFALIGATVLAVFACCFWSAKLFFSELFHNDILAFTIGIIWALMIVNLYLLLLYTISPTLLKNKHSEKRTDKDRPPFFAFVFRIGLIVLLGVIIAQPIKLWVAGTLHADELNSYIKAYKEELYTETVQHSLRLSLSQEVELDRILKMKDEHVTTEAASKIQSDIDIFNKSNVLLTEIDSLKKCRNNDLLLTRQAELNVLMADFYSDDSTFIASYNEFTGQSEILSLIQKRLAGNDETATLIQNSNFYVSKIQLTNEKFMGFSLSITLLIVIIFLFPVFWKYQVRNLSNFYSLKKEIENRMVLDEYAQFKASYLLTFQQLHQKEVPFFESYTDPPFNTQKKSDGREYKQQIDLLKQIYASE